MNTKSNSKQSDRQNFYHSEQKFYQGSKKNQYEDMFKDFYDKVKDDMEKNYKQKGIKAIIIRLINISSANQKEGKRSLRTTRRKYGKKRL